MKLKLGRRNLDVRLCIQHDVRSDLLLALAIPTDPLLLARNAACVETIRGNNDGLLSLTVEQSLLINSPKVVGADDDLRKLYGTF